MRPSSAESVDCASLPSQPVQHVNQLPQAAVIAAVEAERDARQVQAVPAFNFFRRRFDAFDGLSIDDVGEVFVHRGQGGIRRRVFEPDDE